MSLCKEFGAGAGLLAGAVFAALMVVLTGGSQADAGVHFRYHGKHGIHLGLRLRHGYRYGGFYSYRRYHYPYRRYYGYHYGYGYPYGYGYRYDNDRRPNLGLFGRPHIGFVGTYGGLHLGLGEYHRRYSYYGSYGRSYSGSYTDYDDYGSDYDNDGSYRRGTSDYSSDSTYQTNNQYNEQSSRRDTSASEPDGWSLLGSEQSPRAKIWFAQQARDNPNAGRFKVGFALAVADDGNLSGGVWAMRRALRLAPQAVENLQLDASIRERMRAVLQSYASDEADYIDKSDRAFMRAAIHYLLGDTSRAVDLAKQADDAGDASRSLGNLRDLLGDNYAPQRDETDRRDGWTLLAEGHSREALLWFARQATNNPRAGQPKVGYALVVAADGNLSRGVWAMRRAFRLNGETLVYMVLDEPLRKPVGELINAYESASPDSVGLADSAFMRAALNYLIGRYDSANKLAREARNAGDTSAGLEQMEEMLTGRRGSSGGQNHEYPEKQNNTDEESKRPMGDDY